MTTQAPLRFDAKMYATALAFYGLPTNYQRTFKQKIMLDKQTQEPLRDKQGKVRTTLVSCKTPQESAAGNAVWVQVNHSFADAAITTTQNGYTYPKKPANKDIQYIVNVTLDFEYPPDPAVAHAIGNGLARYLVDQGLAEPGLPVEDSGGGCHIVLPIPSIETVTETADLWNKAVCDVVKTNILPHFERLVQNAGVEMDLEGFDISRILSAPGTWRPYRPDKADCEALKGGYLRRWLAPYVDGCYPERKECAKLAVLIRDAYDRLKNTPKEAPKAQSEPRSEGHGPQVWLANYAASHPNSDRSGLFQTLVNACYLKFGEEITTDLAGLINNLAGGKYDGRLENEFQRSLDIAKALPRIAEVIVSNRQLPDIVDDALNALMQAERGNPTIFVKANGLVKVARDKAKGRPIIMRMGAAEFRNALTRTAHYYRLKEKGDAFFKVAVTPPKDLVEAIVSPEDPSTWPFPVLDAIVGIPVMRPDGSILSKPGYDEATHLYYLPPPELVHCPPPEQPMQADARKACAQILELIAEFPFSSQASRANAMGAILTPFIRQAMADEDDVPLGVLDAAAPGTGKGLLSSVVSLLSTGLRMAVLTAPTTEEEWDKKILTELMEGNTLICIDNIPGTLASSSLETVLTAKEYKGRILGASKSASPENRATWLATGNNLKLAGDLPERCYWIRMVATTSDPETREFQIPDLMLHIKTHRCALVVAMLTMIRAWHLAGRPKDPSLKNFRTFTTWSNTIGSILHFSGVEGFLSDRVERKNELDDDRKQWATFLRAWYEKYSTEETTVACIKKDASQEKTAGSGAGSEIFEALPENFQSILTDKPGSFSQLLGKALQKHAERRYGTENFYLQRGTNTRTSVATWRVFAGNAGDNSNPPHGKNETEKNNFLYSGENDIEMGASNPPQSQQEKQEDNSENLTNQPVERIYVKEEASASAGSPLPLPAVHEKNVPELQILPQDHVPVKRRVKL